MVKRSNHRNGNFGQKKRAKEKTKKILRHDLVQIKGMSRIREARERGTRRLGAEGYILHWVDKASSENLGNR